MSLKPIEKGRLFSETVAAVADQHHDGPADQMVSYLPLKHFFGRGTSESFKSQNLESERVESRSLFPKNRGILHNSSDNLLLELYLYSRVLNERIWTPQIFEGSELLQ